MEDEGRWEQENIIDTFLVNKGKSQDMPWMLR